MKARIFRLVLIAALFIPVAIFNVGVSGCGGKTTSTGDSTDTSHPLKSMDTLAPTTADSTTK